MPGLIIPSAHQRRLQLLDFQQNDVLTRDLPRDTVITKAFARLSGAVQTTFGSGTPVADAQSTFDNVIKRIDVIVNGSRTVKAVRPHMMHMQQLLYSGLQGERKSSAGAAAVINPTVDGAFAYGTTTQYTTVAETVEIAFECVVAKEGQESTWLNLKGVASAEMKFITGAFSSLLGFGNTAPVTYANDTFAIDITIEEAKDVPANVFFSDFRQTTKELTYQAETTNSAVEINRGNSLLGIALFTRDGAAGSATTATGKLASNNVLSDISFKLNGNMDIRATTFWKLQAENRASGVYAPYASNVSRLDGYARLDFLKKGRISSALPVMPPQVDAAQLYLSTRSSSDVSYTNPVSVTVQTDELVRPTA